ncbi:Gfo/Idh/MocA family protein [Paenibacillus protaetiae]|nr:Gfo/Idh/MocA family oxidoreductase [Paenibacillus protaetiae]
MTQPVRFGIVGMGWRAEAYLRVAGQLPHLFEIVGIAVRDPAKYKDAAAKWGIRLYSTPEELAKHCDFVLTAVSKASAPAVLQQLASLGVPVLAETPPAADEEGFKRIAELAEAGAPIQVAEQYPLQPHHAARAAVIRSGRIGDVRHVQVSAAHGYHGISLIRHYLSEKAGAECEIAARRFELPILEVPYRGRAVQDKLETELQDIAILSFSNGKSALLDFTRSQYFSPLRQNRLLIRGSHGEIRDNEVTSSISGSGGPGGYETWSIRRLQDGQEGSLAPLSLRELRGGAERLYRNPYYPAPFSDDEIAMAETLSRMADYAKQDTRFYSLQEALMDIRLSMAIDRAAATGQSVRVSPAL